VKRFKIIYSFLSVTLLAAILLGSGGITLVIHTCGMSGITSVKTISALNPDLKSEACCGMPVKNHQENCNSISAKCCSYKIGQLNITSFILSEIPVFTSFAIYHFSPVTAMLPDAGCMSHLPAGIFDKHGGRFIVNSNCQLIS
jgi:hypothetical protein